MATGPSLAWIVGLALLGALAGCLFDPFLGDQGPESCADPLAYLFDMADSGVN
jgi:hypothetical protein